MSLRLVVLVIAHRNPSYEQLQCAWELHWQTTGRDLRGAKRYFLYNDPKQTEHVRVSADGAELTFPHEETYPAPGLLLKTLGAIDYLGHDR